MKVTKEAYFQTASGGCCPIGCAAPTRNGSISRRDSFVRGLSRIPGSFQCAVNRGRDFDVLNGHPDQIDDGDPAFRCSAVLPAGGDGSELDASVFLDPARLERLVDLAPEPALNNCGVCHS